MNKFNSYLKELISLQNISDVEAAHSRADDILVEILISLGLNDIVNEYEKINKWYA